MIRFLLAACLTLACGVGEERAARLADPRLNVVVLTLDTTRADALGSYGQPLPVTPRIDAAAAQGLVFEQVLSSSPSTFPSHATLFTGQQPYAHGVRANAGYVLADQSVTLAEALHDAGWRTGAEVAAAVLGRFQRLDQARSLEVGVGEVEQHVPAFGDLLGLIEVCFRGRPFAEDAPERSTGQETTGKVVVGSRSPQPLNGPVQALLS